MFDYRTLLHDFSSVHGTVTSVAFHLSNYLTDRGILANSEGICSLNRTSMCEIFFGTLLT